MCCASAALPPFPKRSNFPPRSSLSARAAQIAARVSAHSCSNACFTLRLSLTSSSIQAASPRELNPCSDSICFGTLLCNLLLYYYTYCCTHIAVLPHSPFFKYNLISLPLAAPRGWCSTESRCPSAV